MNDFEKRVMAEFTEHHSIPLLKESTETADRYSDIADPALVRDHEMSVATMYRVMYLAVKAYHNALSQHLAANGIALPDLDTLISGSAPQKE